MLWNLENMTGSVKKFAKKERGRKQKGKNLGKLLFDRSEPNCRFIISGKKKLNQTNKILNLNF